MLIKPLLDGSRWDELVLMASAGSSPIGPGGVVTVTQAPPTMCISASAFGQRRPPPQPPPEYPVLIIVPETEQGGQLDTDPCFRPTTTGSRRVSEVAQGPFGSGAVHRPARSELPSLALFFYKESSPGISKFLCLIH